MTRPKRMVPLQLTLDSAALVANYHWFAATTETPERVVTASTAHYFGHPGPAPTALLRAPKAALEIVPQPLPRQKPLRNHLVEQANVIRRRHGNGSQSVRTSVLGGRTQPTAATYSI